jgi:PHD/YefM family antitoxin component YafN of YafNO toxin-antitoxin module
MGKPTSKIVEVLSMAHQPVRYVVTNSEKIILVTHDYYYAKRLENTISKLENPSKFYVQLQK